MGRRRKGARIVGPFWDEKRKAWRVIGHAEDGTRADGCGQTEDEAQEIADRFREELRLEGPITVGEALEAYEKHLRAKGNKPGSIATTMQRLRSIVGTRESRLLDAARSTQERYATLVARARAAHPTKAVGGSTDERRIAVDTHRNALGETRTFGKWCVKQGYLSRNPWAEVEGVGKRRRGKLQLRVDEARTWLKKALELAEQGDDGAVAAMMTLLLGLRASEVIKRVGRDVDSQGTLLWIDCSKTPAGRRVVEVPGVLHQNLVQLAEVAGTVLPLFRPDRHWAREQGGLPPEPAEALRHQGDGPDGPGVDDARRCRRDSRARRRC